MKADGSDQRNLTNSPGEDSICLVDGRPADRFYN